MRRAGELDISAGGDDVSGSGTNASMSASAGRMAINTTGITSTISSVGSQLNVANTVSDNGSNWPVIFSTMFSALPCVACVSAIELEIPLAQTTKPE